MLSMDKNIYDCIIIGGGISGISYAHYLKSINQNTLILEKSNRAGGQIQSISSKNIPGYWRELGSHTCYNSYTHLLSILKESSSEDRIQPLKKSSYVLYDNKIKSLFAGIFPFSLMWNIPKILFSDKTGQTVRQYFRPLFGKRNYDTLFTNAFRAVICQPADDYPAEMFLKRRKTRFEEFPRKYSMKNGLSSFIKHLITKNALNLITESEVISVKLQEGSYTIETKTGNTYTARNIALAVNPQIVSRLLRNIEPEISDRLATIPSFESDSINVIVQKDKLRIKEVAGIISLSDKFMSAVSRDTIEDENYRSFTFHFQQNMADSVEQKNIICKVLDISPADILEIITVGHELPSPRIQHLHLDKQIENIRQNNSVYILGNYFYGLSLEDCVHRSKDEFERYRKQITQ